jgi:hypothetical protein
MSAKAANKCLETGYSESRIGSVCGRGAHADGEAGGRTRNEIDEIAGALGCASLAVVIQALDAEALMRGLRRTGGYRRTKSEWAARTRGPQDRAQLKGRGGLGD